MIVCLHCQRSLPESAYSPAMFRHGRKPQCRACRRPTPLRDHFDTGAAYYDRLARELSGWALAAELGAR